jgi:hypothetical protein
MRIQHVVFSALLLLVAAPVAAQGTDASPWYDKDSITASSAAFAAVSGALQQNYLPLERQVSRTDSLLAELDLSLALSSGVVASAQHKLWTARLNERSGVFGPEFEAIQSRIQELETEFESGFQAALDRALAALASEGITAAPCTPPAPALGGIGPGFSGGRAGCAGEDLSPRIAALWDADATLKARLDAAMAKAWPLVSTYEGQALAVATGGQQPGATWLSPANVAGSVPEVIEYIDAVDRRADLARKELRRTYQELDRDSEQFKELSETVRTRARGIRAFAEASKASAGAELFAALQRARRKGRKAGWSDVVVCLNPSGWGGCEGTDRSDEVAEAIHADKKLAKALAKLLAALEGPDVSVP